MTATPSPFESLVAGNTAIRDLSEYGEERLSVVRITRTTATQIIVELERQGSTPMVLRYDKRDGILKGDSHRAWGRRERIAIATPELIARVEKRKLVDRFTAMKWKDLHLDTLRAVNEAIKTPAP